jgi:hypothetical protein
MHSENLILDRKSGAVYAIVKGPSVPIPPGRYGTIGAKGFHNFDVVAETVVEWIGKGDLLRVDDTLVRPGIAAFDFEGEIEIITKR